MKVNEIITQKFVDALKAGTIPWHKPWQAFGFRNAVSKKLYRGINVLTLSMLGKGEFYLTYNQARSLGGTVKKGSKGVPICFYTTFQVKERGESKSVPILRYFTVFAVEDCENLRWKPPVRKTIEFKPIELCERIVTAQNAVIKHEGVRADYSPSTHEIRMPARETFNSIPHYYATLFHELTHREAKEVGEQLDHSTFGSDPYAREELVAEIGSAFLCNFAQIHDENLWDNSKAYIQNWSERLQNNPQWILTAASKAQKRFDSIVKKAGLNTEEQEKTDGEQIAIEVEDPTTAQVVV